MVLKFNGGYFAIAVICDKIYTDEVLFTQKVSEFQFGFGLKFKIGALNIIDDHTIEAHL